MLGTYSLVPRIRNPSISPGDSIEIEAYITGFGDVPTDIKLYASYPSSILKVDKEGYVGFAQTCIIVGKDRDKNISSIAIGEKQRLKDINTGEIITAVQKFPQNKTGSTFSLNEGIFLKHQILSQLRGEEINEADKRILGESSWDEYPPIFFKLNTSNNAPPGNHDIVLTIFYRDEDIIKIDQKYVVIHIKNWIQRNQKIINVIVVTLGSIALVSEIIQTYFAVLQYYKPI